MKKYVTLFIASVGLLFSMGAAPLYAAPVDVLSGGCGDYQVCKGEGGVYNTIKNVISILVSIAGIIAVIMIVVGGITYATSGGDASQTKRGKDTVIYAVVGLVISIMAYAIVNWVIGKV